MYNADKSYKQKVLQGFERWLQVQFKKRYTNTGKNGGEGAEDIMGTCLQLHISYHLKFLPEKVALVAFKQPCKDSYANQYYCSW